MNNAFLQVVESELLRALHMGDAIGVKRLFEKVDDTEFVVYHNDNDCDIYRYQDNIVRRSLPYIPYDCHGCHATGWEVFVEGRWLDEYEEPLRLLSFFFLNQNIQTYYIFYSQNGSHAHLVIK